MTAQNPWRAIPDDHAPEHRVFRDQVLAGLKQPQKAIPARWLYDAEGSRLFEAITTLPEYYLTRAEIEILKNHSADLAKLTGPGRAVVEFGSGSSIKTQILLRVIEPAAYVPIDISSEMLHESAARLRSGFPGLPVIPLEADFTQSTLLPAPVMPLARLGVLLGSTIGNLTPAAAVDQLRSIRGTLGEESLLLIGLDRVKDEKALLAAYDDSQGVTAAFNLNLVTRINREIGGTLPQGAFTHRALWNNTMSRVEMHLVALHDVVFSVAGKPFAMHAGESIHTENSHKYLPGAAALMLLAGGWTPLCCWCDSARQFDLVLAVAGRTEHAP